MSWTTPRTWVAGEVVTAAILNTHVRDNFLQTAPGIVTTAGDAIYATGANALARIPQGTIAGSVGNPKRISKSADQSITSSTTFANDTHLLQAVGATDKWMGELYLITTGATAGGLKLTWTFPAAGALQALKIGVVFATGNTLETVYAGVASGSSFCSIYTITSPSPMSAVVRFTYQGGGNAGTLQLQWAQQASSGTATTLSKNSYMEMWLVN